MLPPAGPLLLFAAGVLLGRWRPRAGKWLRNGAVVLLYFLCTGFGASLLVQPLERLEAPLLAPKESGAQAIVVLSASRIRHSPDYGGNAVPDFITLSRINYAALLARQTGLPLLVTGGLLSTRPGDEALATGMRRIFEQNYGLPVRWSETASRTTAENALFSARLLRSAGVTRIILVTDAMHMHRARGAFEQTGLEVVPGPTFYLETASPDWSDLLPTAENLRRTHYALYEWLGLALYRLHPTRS